jgi:hypothetical protein
MSTLLLVPYKCDAEQQGSKHTCCVAFQVFDFHHQKFCPGTWTTKEAVHAAMTTWPKGIRPVVHWSESQEGRKPHAHSDYVSVSFQDSRLLSCISNLHWHGLAWKIALVLVDFLEILNDLTN